MVADRGRVNPRPWTGAVAGSRELVGEVVRLAINDMRKPCPLFAVDKDGQWVTVLHRTRKWRVRHRDAVLFLGSSACAVWLSMLGLESTRVLKELRWSEYAAGLLAADRSMSWRHRKMLREGVRRMELIARKVV